MSRNYKVIVGLESTVPCNYVRALGADEEPRPSVEQMLEALLKLQREEDRKRKWTLIIGGVGALFAAARLGVIAIPMIKERRRRRGG